MEITDCVSPLIKELFKLNKAEMTRRRFLLRKNKLTSKQQKELDILNLRTQLFTKEDLQKSIKLLKS